MDFFSEVQRTTVTHAYTCNTSTVVQLLPLLCMYLTYYNLLINLLLYIAWSYSIK